MEMHEFNDCFVASQYHWTHVTVLNLQDKNCEKIMDDLQLRFLVSNGLRVHELKEAIVTVDNGAK